ncbi:MAG: hypothetical protein KF774_18645 [Planctomyces sp.]|nr:hypothetical protein [Planctomyces sp.]
MTRRSPRTQPAANQPETTANAAATTAFCLLALTVSWASADDGWRPLEEPAPLPRPVSARLLEPIPIESRDADARPIPAESAGEHAVLVLFDGRVVTGNITLVRDGYHLGLPGGAAQVLPQAVVRVSADSLEAAYEKLRDAIRNPSPDEHLGLARWCLQQKLWDGAREQLRDGLRLDPNRRDLRELLVRVEDHLNPAGRHRQPDAEAVRTADGFLEAAPRTAAGMLPDALPAFVRRVQPLMVNKCANAGCHGSKTTTEFQLIAVRSTTPSGRAHTLQNLEAVLRWVDADRPADSPLLAALRDDVHSRVFAGTGGAVQQKVLTDWVSSVVRDDVPEDGDPFVASKSTAAVIRTAAAVTTQERAPNPLRKAASPPRLQPVEKDPLLRDVLMEERPDPFDPEAFNREVGSATGAASTGRR